jgi:hypothetical protein
MAIGVYFSPVSMNKAQYDECMSKLAATGADRPKGRSYHSCFGEGDHLMVFDIWDSQEDMDAFGPTLMPILASIGIDPGQPDIMPIVNIVKA